MKFSRVKLYFSCAILVTLPNFVSAEEYKYKYEYEHLTQYDKMNSKSVNNDNWDPVSGKISFSATDISIPGNSKLKVQLRRILESGGYDTTNSLGGFGGKKHTYNSFWNVNPTNKTLLWGLDLPHIRGNILTGYGVRTTGGDTWLGKRECSGNIPDTLQAANTSDPGGQPYNVYSYQYWQGATLHIPGEVTEQFLEAESNHPKYDGIDSTGNGKWRITKSNWMYNTYQCIPTKDGEHQGLLLKSPDGRTIQFDVIKEFINEYDDDTYPNAVTVRRVLLPSKIEDEFGNFVNYVWADGNLTEISSNDGRKITFTYSTNIDGVDYITSATAHGRTWTYDSDGYGKISSVTIPNGKKWTYTYSDSYGSIFLNEDSPQPSYIPSSNRTNPPGYCHVPASTSPKSFKITDPDGLETAYKFERTLMGRYRAGTGIRGTKYPNWSVKFTNKNCTYPMALVEKTITGYKLPSVHSPDALKWTFSYSENQGTYLPSGGHNGMSWSYLHSFVNEHNNYVKSKEYVTVQQGLPDSVLALPSPQSSRVKTATVYGPKSTLMYFINRDASSEFENTILAIDTLANGVLKKRQEFQYEKGVKVGKKLFATLLPTNGISTEYRVNQIESKVTTYHSDGTSSYSTVSEYDDFYGSPTKRIESNDFSSKSKETAYSYKHFFNSNVHQINLPYETKIDNFLVSKYIYIPFTSNKPRDSYVKRLHYRSASSSSWDRSFTFSKNDGTLSKLEFNAKLIKSDGSASSKQRFQSFSNYKRGTPQTVTMPDRYSDSLTFTESVKVNDLGEVTEYIQSNGEQVNFFYDDIGRVSEVDYKNPNRADIKYTWSLSSYSGASRTAYSCILNTDKSCGSKFSYSTTYYDSLLRLYKKKTYDYSTGYKQYAHYEHDQSGNVVFESFPTLYSSSSQGISREFDAFNRLKSEARTGGGTKYFEYLTGNKIKLIDELNATTTTAYLAFGAPEFNAVVEIESPESVETSIVYNRFGNPTSITQGDGSTSVTQVNVYDDLRRLCKVYRPDTGISVYERNSLGEVIWKADGTSHAVGPQNQCTSSTPNSKKVHYKYDNLGAIWKETHGAYTSANKTFTYANSGDLKKIVSGSGLERAYGYRDGSRLEYEYLKVDGKSWRLDYTYDKQGALNSIEYPNNHIVSYAPNGFGRPTEVKRSGLLYASNFLYHYGGQVKSFTYGNGLTHEMHLGGNNLPNKVKDFGNGTTAQNRTVSYYDNLSVKSVIDHRNTAYSLNLITYDDLDRVKSVSAGSGIGNSNLTYDALGNIKTYFSKNRSLTYHYSNNRLTKVDDTKNNKDYPNFVYSDSGNITYNGRKSFVYNLDNQIVESGSNRYTYDGHNRRAKSVDSKGTTFTFYSQSGKLLYREVNGKGINYIYANDKLIAKDGEAGSISSHGLKHSRPFGEQIESAENDVGYTGHLYDQDLGLNYMQARYYDPVIGRFYSNDPVGSTGHNSIVHGFNRYAYANNNPYKYADPDGNSPISVLAKQTAKVGIKQGIQNMGKRQMRRLRRYMSQGQRKEFMSDVADVLGSLDSSPLEIAFELIPVAGDIYGAGKFGKQVASAYDQMQNLENKWAEKIYNSLPADQKKKFVNAMRNAGVRDAKQDAGLPRTGSGLEGHHVDPVANNKSTMSDPRNIQMLTPAEHKKVHQN